MRICCMCMNTADYCAKLSMELETKVKAHMDEKDAAAVHFESSRDLFQSLIPGTSQVIAKRLEVALQGPFTQMTRANWGTIQFVGDQSDYINDIEAVLKQLVPILKMALLSTGHQRFLMDKMVEFVSVKYKYSIYKCKPISEIGAEQLLLDTHALKTVLVALPTFGKAPAAKVSMPPR